MIRTTLGRLPASTDAKQANAETKTLILFLISFGWKPHGRTMKPTTLVNRYTKIQKFAGIGLLGVESKPAL